MNPLAQKYQNTFASFFNLPYAFAFWKGRVALYILLKALGVKPGDQVILPGYTCTMDVNPIIYLHAKPIYLDIDPNTYNMNVNLLEENITPKTTAIIAQHTYGYPVDMNPLMKIANRHNIPVIEDCCLALGSTYKGQLLGTFGAAAYFSMQWNKPYTTGLGGMAITDNPDLAQKINTLCKQELIPVPNSKAALLACQLALYRTLVYPQTTAWLQNTYRFLTRKGLIIGSSSKVELQSTEMEKDFCMAACSVQHAQGLRQLSILKQNLNHRKNITAIYDNLLENQGWEKRLTPPNADPILVRYPLRVTDKWAAVERAAKKGLEIGTWFESPLHPRETNLDLYHYRPGQCPIAEQAAQQTINLPTHPRTTKTTAKKTVNFLKNFRPQ